MAINMNKTDVTRIRKNVSEAETLDKKVEQYKAKIQKMKQDSFDILNASGVIPTAFNGYKQPKKGAIPGDPEVWELFRPALAMAFTPRVRKLLETPTDELPSDKEKDKTTANTVQGKRYWEQQLGSKMAAWGRQYAAYLKRTNPENSEGDDEKEKSSKSPEVKALEHLTAVLKLLQGDNPPKGNVGKAATSVKAALKALNMEVPDTEE